MYPPLPQQQDDYFVSLDGSLAAILAENGIDGDDLKAIEEEINRVLSSDPERDLKTQIIDNTVNISNGDCAPVTSGNGRTEMVCTFN